MIETEFQKRKAVRLETGELRVTATTEGGHIAEIQHKPTGVNPLWTPPWPSLEPSLYNKAKHPEYGAGIDAPLLAGILGHNLCVDLFGGPSPEEAAAGMPVHGESSSVAYRHSGSADSVRMEAFFPIAHLQFARTISVQPGSSVVRISESVENISASDRPIAWTQHVTLGPPFLANGVTQFRIPIARSVTGDRSFNDDAGPYVSEQEFDWPHCPLKRGGTADLSVYSGANVSGGFSAHLLDPKREQVFFIAWSPVTRVLFGYVWKRADFPWLARWEENRLRTAPPWNGKAITCGMEFGVSPMPESRRQMIDRGSLFGFPAYRWAPARATLRAEYCAFITTADQIPESVTWDGAFGIDFKR